MSKDSDRTDRLAKLMEHQSLASVRRYVMLEENQVFAAVITRAPDHWGF